MKKNIFSLKVIIVVLFLILFIFAFWRYSAMKKQADDSGQGTDSQVEELLQLEGENFEVKDSQASVESVRSIDESDHFLGSLEAPVQIIVYEDFDCQFCVELDDTLKKVQDKYADQVVIAFRYSPMAARSRSYRASLAAECASEQDNFWEMYEKLFFNYQTGNLNIDQYKDDAKNLGLDTNQFARCLEDEKYRYVIEEQAEEAVNSSAHGSPTIFVNGDILPGAYPFEDFSNQQGEMQEGLDNIIQSKLN